MLCFHLFQMSSGAAGTNQDPIRIQATAVFSFASKEFKRFGNQLGSKQMLCLHVFQKSSSALETNLDPIKIQADAVFSFYSQEFKSSGNQLGSN